LGQHHAAPAASAERHHHGEGDGDAFAARVKRQGVVNAWDNRAFAKACRNTRRKNFVMAGVTTDVCMVAPAISAVEEGFIVKVVCDACGSTNQIAEEMSWCRMERAGVGLTSINAIVAELVKNWASPASAVAFPLLTRTSGVGELTDWRLYLHQWRPTLRSSGPPSVAAELKR
jgi:hypothetical protein